MHYKVAELNVICSRAGWRLQPLNDREPDLVVLTDALGCFLSDADGQAQAGLKACHINQVRSLHRWKRARYQWQRGRDQGKEEEWNINKRGTRYACMKLPHLKLACASSWKDISKWPLLSDSFLDATHSELPRTWQVNNVISWCVQTVPLTTVKYQHKANRADVYAAVWGVLRHLAAFQTQSFNWKTLLSFQFSSPTGGKIKANTSIKIPNILPSRKTKCNMTWTERVCSSPSMQNQYPSSFCSHLYT